MLTRSEKFILDITEIDLYWHRLASIEMGKLGLKGSYALYFTRLYSRPEGMTAAELGAACGKDKADVSRDIAALEESGFMERRRPGDSGYRAVIVLTEKGRALTETISRRAETAVDCIGRDLSDVDRECFYRVLDQITENLQTLSRTGIPDGE